MPASTLECPLAMLSLLLGGEVRVNWGAGRCLLCVGGVVVVVVAGASGRGGSGSCVDEEALPTLCAGCVWCVCVWWGEELSGRAGWLGWLGFVRLGLGGGKKSTEPGGKCCWGEDEKGEGGHARACECVCECARGCTFESQELGGAWCAGKSGRKPSEEL